MGDFRTHSQSFSGGEVTPEFFGQLADPKFQTGLAKCRNCVVKPHGPVENRPGSYFVQEVRDSTKLTRLLPFVYGFNQSLVIQFAQGAFRFHSLGQTLLHDEAAVWVTATAYKQGDLVESGGSTYYALEDHTSAGTFAADAAKWYAQPLTGEYEVPHPYLEDQLFEVTYAQSADIMKLASREHPRRELRRLGSARWVLVDLKVGPVLLPPTGVSGTATAGDTPGTPFDTEYVITAITSAGDESLQSTVVTVSNNLYDDGARNDLAWTASTGAERYNIYKRASGLLGYIGQTDQLTFRDDNIAPDLGSTPPLDVQIFDKPGDYPGAVAYQEQRSVWAGTINQPQNVWTTRVGTENNFNYSIPARDDDSIQFRIASRENNAIYHLVPMADLIVGTPAALWRVGGGLSEVLTPLTLSAREQTFSGMSQTKPIKVGNNMLYVSAEGGHLREFGFDGDRNGYISGDVSLRAPHLFDFDAIRSMTLQKAPFPVIWACATSGIMIGFTYIPEQQIAAFHWHDTDGVFEDATCIYEEGRVVVYLAVRRVIGGQTVRYVERFADRNFKEQADQYFVDCGLTYRGAPTNSVTGAHWLEGKEVSILADGAVLPPQRIVGGKLTLPDEIEASVISFGLPYTSDVETLPIALDLKGAAYTQGMPKNVNAVYLRVYRTANLLAGPSLEELVEAKVRTTEDLGSPPNLQTGEVEIVMQGAWGEDGAVFVRNQDPTALTLLAMTMDVALGGG